MIPNLVLICNSSFKKRPPILIPLKAIFCDYLQIGFVVGQVDSGQLKFNHLSAYIYTRAKRKCFQYHQDGEESGRTCGRQREVVNPLGRIYINC